MTALPNPYITDPTIATQPLPFLLDTAKFLKDLYGTHILPEVEPLELDIAPPIFIRDPSPEYLDAIDFDAIADVLRKY